MKSRIFIADEVLHYIRQMGQNLQVNESDTFESLGLGIYSATTFTYTMESEFKIKFSDSMLLNFHKKPIRNIINELQKVIK